MATKKLTRQDVICGYNANTIRSFFLFSFSENDGVGSEYFERDAKQCFGDDAKAVVAEFIKRGWIINIEAGDIDQQQYHLKPGKPAVLLTIAGRQSRIISLNKRFSRAAGEKEVAELVARAKAINADPDLGSFVREIRLYGSMLDPQAETIGDVDVSYSLGRKKPPLGLKWTDWSHQRARATGRSLTFMQNLFFNEHEVKKLLRARRPRLSLTDISTFEELEPVPKFEIIFKDIREAA